ncbi:putative Transcription factor MYB93 [Cocos nucifera]|uniref:Putative Transcription factor MYB93 n=1 Tax=Cocos nucifera TaxID=13894 RepID=A0A8K0I343_COCNU|nr:putative Transcription factor MYB93 [Cocos nucifera]
MALASLGALMDYRSFDDQLRAEAVQLANLQCLQHLLQSPAAIDGSAIGNNLGSITSEMDFSTNLPNQPLTTMSANLSQTPFTVVVNAQTQLHHLSEILCSLEQPLGNDAKESSTSIDFRQRESKSLATPMVSPPPPPALPPLADASMGSGDACSSYSYGGSSVTASFWPEVLFDEPLLTEFA